MRILAVAGNKGGVGKTSLTRLLAEYFGRTGRVVLAIDLDPQSNLSRRFIEMDYDPSDPDGVLPPLHPDYEDGDPDWNGRSSSADVYFNGEVYPYPTRWDSLHLLPGHGPRLRTVELVTEDEVKEKVINRLRDFLAMADVRNAFELVLIDTSPSKGPLNRSAMRAATHLLFPTTMEPQAIEGLQGMMQMWRREQATREVDDPCEIVAIQPNLARHNVALHEGYLDGLRNDERVGSLVSPVLLHQRIAFAEADHPEAEPKSVFELPDRNAAREEASAFCQYVERRLFS